jgi:hypothetical protein
MNAPRFRYPFVLRIPVATSLLLLAVVCEDLARAQTPAPDQSTQLEFRDFVPFEYTFHRPDGVSARRKSFLTIVQIVPGSFWELIGSNQESDD